MSPSAPSSPLGARIYRALVSQKTGVVCAFSAAGLLATGSVLADRLPGVYQDLSGGDLRFFFEPVRAVHLWLYAAMVVFAVWGLSTLLCTLEALRSRWQARCWRPGAWGTILVHLSFILALVAHLLGGLTADGREHLVAGDGTDIAGARYRALGVDQQSWPNGMPKTLRVELERTKGSERSLVYVGFNEPVVLEGGARELLLGRIGQGAGAAILRVGGEQVRLRPGESAAVRGRTVTLQKLHMAQSLRVPVVSLLLDGGEPQRTMLPLDPGSTDELAFVGIESTPLVSLRERYDPSIPLVLAVALLLALGVVLTAWEHLRRERQAETP
jgi:hypothetical protein